MKQRETRLNVLMPSRIRWEGQWLPATVRNVSSRGMALRLPQPPRPGTYVEVEVGAVSVAGRTMWSGEQACGLHLRERFDLSAMNPARVGNAALSIAQRPSAQPARYRPALSIPEQEARGRALSSLIQYVISAAVVVIAAVGVGWEVYQTLSAPMQSIQSALDSSR